MKLKGKRIGFVMTGSFCTFKNTIEQLKKIVEEGAEILPIMSYNAYNLDTKFGRNKDIKTEIEKITREKNNPYNSRSRIHWTKTYDGHNDNYTSNWKYDSQTGK